MTYVKWIFLALIATFAVGFMHYTLPQKDIVRVVGVENRRIDFGNNSIFWAAPDAGSANMTTRDVRFVETVRPSGRAMVYRNEDTGWGWPPYFKLDSSNLQAEVRDLISTQANPRWVAVTHYGWRSEFLSIFPNIISIKPVDGPEVRLIPWFNIIFLTLLGALIWAIIVRINRFRRNRIDPVLEDIDEAWDDAGEAVSNRATGLRKWFKGLGGGPKG